MNEEFINLINAIADHYAPVWARPNPLNGEWIAGAVQGAVDGEIPPYVGMGNPDADILMVGREKALNPADAAYWDIILHELILNHAHWYDIVHDHADVHPHEVALLGRGAPFTWFSPYNPLRWLPTWTMVTGPGHHTYQGMWTAVNCNTGNADVNGLGQLNAAAAEAWQWRLFDKVFITELNLRVAKSSRKTRFKLTEWLEGPRFAFMAGMGAAFYQRFKTVVIYTGVNGAYVGQSGSAERLSLLQLFNPALGHADRHVHTFDLLWQHRGIGHAPVPYSSMRIEEYASGDGRRLLIMPHLSGSQGRIAAAAIQHLLCIEHGAGAAAGQG
jgi:hypothetical protein